MAYDLFNDHNSASEMSTFLMPKKALQAAAALGDKEALAELAQMKEHTLVGWIVTCVAAILIVGIMCGAQHCANESSNEEIQIKADKEIRLKYAAECKFVPSSADQLQLKEAAAK